MRSPDLIDRLEPTVDWSVDARTVHHVHRQSELATALSDVRGDVALLAGLDPRWTRVNEALERGADHDEALEQLLTGPLGKLVLDELKKRVDEEHTPARASMRPAPNLETAEGSTPVEDDELPPLAVPVRRRFPIGVAMVAIATFTLAVAVGYGIGTLGAKDEGTITPSVAQSPHAYPLPSE